MFRKHPRIFYGEFVFVAVAMLFGCEAGLGAIIMPDEKLTEVLVVIGKSLPAVAWVAKATDRPNQPYSRQVALVRDGLVLSRQPPNHPYLWQVTMGVEIVSVPSMQSPNPP